MRALLENPILPGFHPDPSLCRAGEDYYLVTSSFEYFPGLPLFHSRDLVHWRQLGHCLTRGSQLDLSTATTSGGVYAPTIRHHEGTFYVVATNATGRGHFIVTARDPAGEWSDPVWLEGGGIDPSLLFDEDGRVYLTSTNTGGTGEVMPGGGLGIVQREIDPATGRAITRPRRVWSGSGGKFPEGPHLYRAGTGYYLLLAEGGTEYGHMVTLARSPSPWGPFEPCPRNPILSHRSLESPFQATGHGDLLEDHRGRWWLACLGVRPNGHPPRHHLGRETFLAPVEWSPDGWPFVGHGGRIEPSMAVDAPPAHPWPAPPPVDDFDGPGLRPEWNFLRNPAPGSWSLSARPGWLRLRGGELGLDDFGSPALVGRRQQHFECAARTVLDFEPHHEGEEAGLAVRMDERHHYEIALALHEGERAVIVRQRVGSLQAVVAREPVGPGPLTLEVRADREGYRFACSPRGQGPRFLALGETRYLTSEVAGGFTGVYLALYATGSGRPVAGPADFDRFEYHPQG